MIRQSSIVFVRAAVVVAGLACATASFAKDQVVFQLTEADPARGALVLNNVRNLQAGVGTDDIDIEVVAYGPGVVLLKADSPLAARIAETVGRSVKVVACENTMAGMKLAKTDMVPEVGYVPAGVVEVMRKQQQGYAYIRP